MSLNPKPSVKKTSANPRKQDERLGWKNMRGRRQRGVRAALWEIEIVRGYAQARVMMRQVRSDLIRVGVDGL